MSRTRSSAKNNSTANLGFEAKLWLAADKLRNNMDAAEYKHVVLGLIFLKYISDAFEEHHAKLVAGKGDYAGADPEDPDEYRPRTSSGCRQEARWSLPPGQRQAARPSARSSTTPWSPSSATTRASRACCPRTTPAPASTSTASANSSTSSAPSAWATRETAPRTSSAASTNTSSAQFASAEGKNGGQFYTPRCVVRAAGRDARALQGPRLRPLLRLRRHVRAVGEVRRSPRRQARRHQHLRPGEQPHHLAAGR